MSDTDDKRFKEGVEFAVGNIRTLLASQAPAALADPGQAQTKEQS